ncbi:hypothetical protein PYV02_09615 [Leifsonia sp. H3M29-4]|uniref:hypothetical protein n=1 Tax=Salinibacterium metalliresistens TaxID=3031321 RepID=UPI0023DA1736|nr:hypothetical protein [Salinibacterium metalliresistens]MDF1479337.1 hypothetical protein [Salinibacterium metalliresistens]
MSRSVIAKLFYGSLIAFAVVIVLVGVVIGLAISTRSLMMDGRDVVGVSPSGWWIVAVAVVMLLLIVGASIAQLVAWIGALIESATLENMTWFVVVLVGGILGFGVIVMLIYLLAVPARTVPSSPAAAAAVSQ